MKSRDAGTASEPLLPSTSAASRRGSASADLVEKATSNGPDVESGIQAKRERGMLAVATVALLVSALSNVALPQFAGRLVDTVTSFSDTEEGRAVAKAAVGGTLLRMCGIIIIGSLFSALRIYLFTAASEKVVARLRKDLFTSLMNQEIAFFDVTRSGELLSRLSEDTQVIKNAATTNLSEALRSLATGLFGLGYMLATSWQLTLLTLGVIPPVSVGIRFFGMYIRKVSEKTQSASAAAASVAEECLGSIRTVRAFGQEDWETDRYGGKVEESMRLGIQQAVAIALFGGGVFGAAALCIVTVLVYGARLTIDGKMTAGTLSSFILFSVTVGFSFAALSGLYATFMKAVGASRRVFQLLDRVSQMPPAGKAKPALDSSGGSVVLSGVWFAYPSRPKDFVLKSTIANLVERMYDPQKGSISIGHVALQEVDHKYLHSQVSIVSQEPTLFNQSISANIRYGRRNASLEEVVEAAKMANAHEFVTNFPNGYDTEVGERGVRLSGGQKQRIAIARALLCNPRVLLLDEATSALDAESEFLVQEAMDRLMSGRTTLVIAHRLSTVKGADVVAVVDKGGIAERGTHSELLSQGGIYAGLVRRQLQGATSELNLGGKE